MKNVTFRPVQTPIQSELTHLSRIKGLVRLLKITTAIVHPFSNIYCSMDIIARNHIHVIGNLDASQTLMFAHGFGIDQTSFSQVTPSFESDYKIVLFDIPARQRTTGSGGCHSIVSLIHFFNLIL